MPPPPPASMMPPPSTGNLNGGNQNGSRGGPSVELQREVDQVGSFRRDPVNWIQRPAIRAQEILLEKESKIQDLQETVEIL